MPTTAVPGAPRPYLTRRPRTPASPLLPDLPRVGLGGTRPRGPNLFVSEGRAGCRSRGPGSARDEEEGGDEAGVLSGRGRCGLR